MKNNTWYLIGVKKDKNGSIGNYVESMEFRNRHWKQFQNNTTQFTDDSNFALRLRSKTLATSLSKIVQKAVPQLIVEVIEIEDRWFK